MNGSLHYQCMSTKLSMAWICLTPSFWCIGTDPGPSTDQWWTSGKHNLKNSEVYYGCIKFRSRSRIQHISQYYMGIWLHLSYSPITVFRELTTHHGNENIFDELEIHLDQTRQQVPPFIKIFIIKSVFQDLHALIWHKIIIKMNKKFNKNHFYAHFKCKYGILQSNIVKIHKIIKKIVFFLMLHKGVVIWFPKG